MVCVRLAPAPLYSPQNRPEIAKGKKKKRNEKKKKKDCRECVILLVVEETLGPSGPDQQPKVFLPKGGGGGRAYIPVVARQQRLSHLSLDDGYRPFKEKGGGKKKSTLKLVPLIFI